MHAIVATATESVLLVGYAIYNSRTIFKQLASRMDGHPELDVKFLLNVLRHPTNTSEASLIGALAVKRGKGMTKQTWTVGTSVLSASAPACARHGSNV
jgi:hypothetical protein